MKVYEDNQSDKHLTVNSLTVIKGIEGGGITSIETNLENLRQAQQSLAEETKDYWTQLAADNSITPEEKKILYKEWNFLSDREYPSLLAEALTILIETAPEIVNYKAAYKTLYDYLITELAVFDDMTTTTTLDSRETFIANYNNYYSTRDLLRTAMKEGQFVEVRDDYNGQLDKVRADLEGITQGGVADGSITIDKLAADIRQSFIDFNAAAEKGFLTDQIIADIDSKVEASSNDINLRIDSVERDSKLRLQIQADRFVGLIDDAKRQTRSMLFQNSSMFQVDIIDFKNKTATQFEQTAEAIKISATDLESKIASSVQVTTDRITEIVQAGSTDAYLSLSVGVPYFITVSKYQEWFDALDKEGQGYLTLVYDKVKMGETEEDYYYYYVMKSTVEQGTVNSLNNKLRAIDRLASQVVIEADMIQLAGTAIFSSDNTIKQTYIDYSGYATDEALEKVDVKAGVANAAATDAVNTAKAAATTATDSKTWTDGFIKAILDENAIYNGTTIKGGYIRTGLLKADAILAKDVLSFDIVASGTIKSNEYEPGTTENPEGKGFLIDCKNGNVDFSNGTFRGNIYAKSGTFKGDLISRGFWFEYVDGDIELKKVQYSYDPVDDISGGKDFILFESAGEGNIGIEFKTIKADFTYNNTLIATLFVGDTKIGEWQAGGRGNVYVSIPRQTKLNVSVGQTVKLRIRSASATPTYYQVYQAVVMQKYYNVVMARLS